MVSFQNGDNENLGRDGSKNLTIGKVLSSGSESAIKKTRGSSVQRNSKKKKLLHSSYDANEKASLFAPTGLYNLLKGQQRERKHK